MAWKVIHESIGAKSTGVSLKINKGQIFRVELYEGKQVADINFYNAHNYKEQFADAFTAVVNSMRGWGGYYRATKLYSKPPYENVMLTVMDDPTAHHYLIGHCTRQLYGKEYYKAFGGYLGHRSCQDNFTDALSDNGIKIEDFYSESVFNAFMIAYIDNETGLMRIDRPNAGTGDYIEFRAEMDIIALVSVCADDISPCNDFATKALKFQIKEWEDEIS